MRRSGWSERLAVAATLLCLFGGRPVLAQTAPVITDQASDCEISRALGLRIEGCSRGLAIGGMPPAPAPTPPPGREYKAAFRINFEFGSAKLTADARSLLDKIAKVLTAPAAGTVRFRIAGHTDSVGNAARNQVLSERRAQAVVEYLSTIHKMEPTRLESVGKGSSEPLIPANPAAADNRRVEIINLGG